MTAAPSAGSSMQTERASTRECVSSSRRPNAVFKEPPKCQPPSGGAEKVLSLVDEDVGANASDTNSHSGLDRARLGACDHVTPRSK